MSVGRLRQPEWQKIRGRESRLCRNGSAPAFCRQGWMGASTMRNPILSLAVVGL
jgi:hypothetical protein